MCCAENDILVMYVFYTTKAIQLVDTITSEASWQIIIQAFTSV